MKLEKIQEEAPTPFNAKREALKPTFTASANSTPRANYRKSGQLEEMMNQIQGSPTNSPSQFPHQWKQEETSEDKREQGQTKKKLDVALKVNSIYERLQNRLRLKKSSGEKNFRKIMEEFKKLDSFVDTRSQIQNMNLAFQKGFQSNLEVLKIRDKIQKLNKELQDTSSKYQQQFGEVISLTDDPSLQVIKGDVKAKELLNKSKKFLKESQKERINHMDGTTQLAESLKDYIQKKTQMVNQIEVKDDANEFYTNIEAVFQHQTKLIILKEQHDELELRKQEEKEQQLRDLIKISKYDVQNNEEDSKNVPNQMYFDEYHRKTQQAINKAINESKKIYREKLGLMNSRDKLFTDIKENIISKRKNGQKQSQDQFTYNNQGSYTSLAELEGGVTSQIPSQRNISANKIQSNKLVKSQRNILWTIPPVNDGLDQFSANVERELAQQNLNSRDCDKGEIMTARETYNNNDFEAQKKGGAFFTSISSTFYKTPNNQESHKILPVINKGSHNNQRIMNRTSTEKNFPKQSFYSGNEQNSRERQRQAQTGFNQNNFRNSRSDLRQTRSQNQSLVGFRNNHNNNQVQSQESSQIEEKRRSFGTISEEIKKAAQDFGANLQLAKDSEPRKNISILNSFSPNSSRYSRDTKKFSSLSNFGISSQQDAMRNFISSMKEAECVYKQENKEFVSEMTEALSNFRQTSEKYEDPKITSIREVKPTEEHKFKTFLRRSYKPKTMQVSNY